MVGAAGMLIIRGTLTRSQAISLADQYPYFVTVFIFPPRDGVYRTDNQRDQAYAAAVQVFQATSRWHEACGYKLIEVPVACRKIERTSC